MPSYDYFELHRLSDDLIYKFDKKKLPNGDYGYQRRDQDLWITFDNKFGWGAYNEETTEIMGRSWNVMPSEQTSDHPPAGEWVSKKQTKSYVYELKYIKHL